MLGAALLGCGPAHPPRVDPPRRFVLATDAFAFRNESHWVYVDDPATGGRTFTEAAPPPRFALHCSGVVRAARQFLVNARFEPAAPRLEPERYLELARDVLARDPRRVTTDAPPVVIPGYRDLREFSADFTPMLQEELLRDWRSVIPREDWRIVVPFTPASQARTADELLHEVRSGTPATVRVVRFPVMTLNHALLLFDASERDGVIEFQSYDPNDPSVARTIRFDRAAQTFVFPQCRYFDGGPVKLYEIYVVRS